MNNTQTDRAGQKGFVVVYLSWQTLQGVVSLLQNLTGFQGALVNYCTQNLQTCRVKDVILLHFVGVLRESLWYK